MDRCCTVGASKVSTTESGLGEYRKRLGRVKEASGISGHPRRPYLLSCALTPPAADPLVCREWLTQRRQPMTVPSFASSTMRTISNSKTDGSTISSFCGQRSFFVLVRCNFHCATIRFEVHTFRNGNVTSRLVASAAHQSQPSRKLKRNTYIVELTALSQHCDIQSRPQHMPIKSPQSLIRACSCMTSVQP